MWIQVSTKQGHLLICNVYRPPNFTDFWGHFDSNIELVKSDSISKSILLLGDMNADFLSPDGKKLLNVCLLHNLLCHIQEPTRITNSTSSCLDQVISNIPNFVTSTSVDPPVSTNDHCTVGVDLAFNLVHDVPYYRHIWLYDQGDYIGFSNAVKEISWDECFDTHDVNTACFRWTEEILNVARVFIPNKSVLIRPRDSPWYTSNLRTMKRRLVRLYHKAKQKNNYHWTKYKQYNFLYHDALNKAENDYNQKLSESLKFCRNDKVWWKTVKHFISKGNTQSYPPILSAEFNCYRSIPGFPRKLR